MAAQFKGFSLLRPLPKLAISKVGFSFLLDSSGKLFKPKAPSLKDVESNVEAIFAVMKTSNGIKRFSALTLRDAIIEFYEKNKLFPAGLSGNMTVIDDWATRQGAALQRLVP